MGGYEEAKRGQIYILIEGDQMLGDEHTMQYTKDVLQNSTLEMYITLLTNVNPSKLN